MNLFKSLDRGIKKKFARTPAPALVASFHQIQVTGGLGRSTTMVMVFVR
jgi:hypothetical protein